MDQSFGGNTLRNIHAWVQRGTWIILQGSGLISSQELSVLHDRVSLSRREITTDLRPFLFSGKWSSGAQEQGFGI